MFDRIAHRYDLLNRLLSLGRDVAWRKQVSRYLPQRDSCAVLDLATGTADMLISLHKNSGMVTVGVGVDMSEEMLKIARRKIEDRDLQEVLSVVEGDALTLPFASGSFDAVTIAFGIRNLDDVSEGLRHMHRVLNDGGKALILEFSLPSNRAMRWIYLLYFRYVLPAVGAVISGDSYAYRYLNRTVETFPHGDDFCQLMRQVGFTDIRAHPLTFGIATVYEGTRQDTETLAAERIDTTDTSETYRRTLDAMARRIENTLADYPAGDMQISGRLIRLELPVTDIEPLEWLEGVDSDVKLYWSDRGGEFEIAGAGMADSHDDSDGRDFSEVLASIQSLLSAARDETRYYGGCRFDMTRSCDSHWGAFGAYRFILPRFEIARTRTGTQLVCNLLPQRDKAKIPMILDELRRLHLSHDQAPQHVAAFVSRKDFPDLSGWREAVSAFLEQSHSEGFEKLVLARRTDLAYRENVPGLKILRRLGHTTDNCYRFYFQPAVGVAFFGATPERLYRRAGGRLECEAIAGTRLRGSDEEEDRLLAEDLRQNAKDLREHRLVVASIIEGLSRLAESGPDVAGEAESILKLVNVQHLQTRMEAVLKNGVTDAEVVTALHPTAAVGGYPRRGVLSAIAGLENFDRGWYAGPVGWVAGDSSEFVVAIRSAIAMLKHLSLFAGAGILEGSDADAEWNELESKISNLMKVLSHENA